MFRAIVALLACAALTVAQPTVAPRPLPKGPPSAPPPRFVTVTKLDRDSGIVTCHEIVCEEVTQTSAETRGRDGKQIPVTVRRTVCKPVEVKFDVAKGRVYDGAGLVKRSRVWARLQPGMIVLMSSDGKRPHDTWRSVFKKSTLTLVPTLRLEPTAKNSEKE